MAGAGKRPQTAFIHLKTRELFGMAGLYAHWTDPATGEVLTTCTIVTTAANTLMRALHERMPVTLPPEQYTPWLDPRNTDPDFLRALIQLFPAVCVP